VLATGKAATTDSAGGATVVGVLDTTVVVVSAELPGVEVVVVSAGVLFTWVNVKAS
jgi:hypothetical protein